MINTNAPRKAVKDLTTSDFVKAYSGKAGRCCCGCSGKYYPAGDKMVARILKKIQASDPSKVDFGATYVAVDNETRQWILYTE